MSQDEVQADLPDATSTWFVTNCFHFDSLSLTRLLADPESYAWDPLDDEVLQKLDRSTYVSLSRDRRLEAYRRNPAAVDNGSNEENARGRGLFNVGMPGAMPLDEVLRQINLNNVPIGLVDEETGVRVTPPDALVCEIDSPGS